ncbi:c-type cytochrome [Sulfitobacter pontiacus]|uniref:c-type cytochrome n=1 Tax=Sulfitobacter pontiacus TaxID=60137 RepID=UPI0030ED323B
MSKFLNSIALCLIATATALPLAAAPFGLGRAALPEEIAAWDVDVLPDGRGLPEGQGDVLTGEAIFTEKCAACHGDFAEGRGNWPALAGGQDTLADADPVKTVGSYWPHLSTSFDYIRRSMPYGDAGTLTADEVYAIVAYILYSNDLVAEEFTLSKDNFATVRMPNADGFLRDDRDTTEVPRWLAAPCMTDCKGSVKVTMRALSLDVTPKDAAPATEPQETPVADVEQVSEPAADPALLADGELVFRKCKACHQLGKRAKNRAGPVLNGIVGAPVGGVEGFKYSRALMAQAEDGLIWTPQTLDAFLAAPRSFMKGTKMGFSGLKSDAEIRAVIAYLNSFPAP